MDYLVQSDNKFVGTPLHQWFMQLDHIIYGQTPTCPQWHIRGCDQGAIEW